jgi:poly(A) polymerase
MLQRGILKPVLPEIEPERLCELEALVLAERSAGFEPESVRRLAALLPPDPELADQVAVRLKLSNKLRKRLSTAAAPITGGSPEALTYRLGPDSAQDQLLLASRAADARTIAGWTPPRLPIGGGALIARGLPEGPIVATTLRQIEQQWVDAGFPGGAAFDTIVDNAIAAAKAQLN